MGLGRGRDDGGGGDVDVLLKWIADQMGRTESEAFLDWIPPTIFIRGVLGWDLQ
jgi:hypothetical protein